jgi:hypothetical protein
MKTIFRTKRPQNKYIGFSLLLLIAVFGFFIGGVKPPTGDVAQTPIGGNGSIVVPAPTPLSVAGDIGGQKIPQDPDPLGYEDEFEIGWNQGQPKDSGPLGLAFEIGGQQVPRDPNPVTFTIPAEIGGDNQQKPKDPNPLGVDIGGHHVPGDPAPLGFAFQDIGGNSIPKTENGFAIGGQGVPGSETRNANSLDPVDIGGNQGVPTPPILPHVADIGGQGTVTPPPTLPLVGGGQTSPRLVTEIGGNGTGSQTPKDIQQIASRYDGDIGGQSTPRTGGGCVCVFNGQADL